MLSPSGFAASLTNLAVEFGLIIGGGVLFAILLLAIIVFAVRSRGNEGYEQLPN
jgi:hypothetical protein